ncbi:hypothetical protein LMG29542_08711 [Paraburkholderia humisilvae]|uniref:Uncharacterized protein n=1 Tax=Paraburkholderia humisilvae TaxID=627669 RepID=A0A6J5F952_9BURK|nr:hypothetical protein LMG29542_08711 [Paraburkholderia humisilvae]
MQAVPDPDAQNSRPNTKRDWAACLSAQGERDKIHAPGMGCVGDAGRSQVHGRRNSAVSQRGHAGRGPSMTV